MIQSPAGYQGDVRIKRYLDFYQAGYGVAMLSSGTTAFTPASLFAASEPGGWYDPSDLTTLYQDAAGTTPVTAVEQPVGLVLDKSKGLTLGAELVSNGAFDTDTTGWTVIGGASLSVSSGRLRVTSNGTLSRARQTVTVTSGRWYKITIDAYKGTANNYLVYLGSTTGGNDYLNKQSPDGPFTAYFYATTTLLSIDLFCGTSTNGLYSEYDNISVRELPGAHLSQSTAAARPVLSARVNLLTRTEEFDNAAWVKNNATVDPTKVTAPNGTTTAQLIYPTTTGSARSVYQTAGAGNKLSVAAKAAGFSHLWLIDKTGNAGSAWFNLSTGTKGTVLSGFTSTIEPLGDGWYHCTVEAATGKFDYAQLGMSDADNSWTATKSGTNGIYIWGADLRPANAGVGLPAYQRVGAATDYDTTGFPLYLKFDGTDDGLSSAAIDFSATDEMTVFAGVRKLSDALTSIVVELSANSGSNAGSFYITAPNNNATANINFVAGGSISPGSISATATAPVTAVVTGLADISADARTLRLDGAVAASDTSTNLGTGNFGNYPLYVGSRAGSSLRFNGHLYSLIVRGAATDAATITATETWVNQRTKAF